MKWLLLASFVLAQAPEVGRQPLRVTTFRIGESYPFVGGRIVTEDGHRFPLFLPSLYIYVHNGVGMRQTVMGPDGVKIKGSGTFGSIPVSKDGRFWFSLPDGEYRISLITSNGEPLSPADGYYVKSFTSESTDLTREPLKMDKTHPPSITIVLAAAP